MSTVLRRIAAGPADVRMEGARTVRLAPTDATPDRRPPRALEDASGRRLRRMRWIGRAVVLLFLVWFAAILLGALGVGPTGRVPFGRALRPGPGPAPLHRLPPPRQPAPADLVPARPATAVAPGTAPSAPTAIPSRKQGAVRGRSAVAPGHATPKVRGRSSSAPGHLRRHGASAPGRLRQATTTAATTTTATTTTKPGHRLPRGKRR
jgi:hypothetical protein